MDLFNNPFITEARKALPEKDQKRFEMLGESMYKDIDFEKVSETNLPPFMVESLMSIDTMIKKGLHISMLSSEEQKFMLEIKGDKWYELYGFTKEDLTDIVNLYTSS